MSITYIKDGKEYLSEYDFRRDYPNYVFATLNHATAQKLGVEIVEKEVVTPEEVLVRNKKIDLLKNVKAQYDLYVAKGVTIYSSLGFVVDADDYAIIDINSLISTSESDDQIIDFNDAFNEIHKITVGDLKILMKEVYENRIYVRHQKQELVEKINSCDNMHDLNEIVIDYRSRDFSK